MIPLAGALASIPSPSDGSISIGPLELRAYGLMIALGVLAAVWLTGRRFEQRGIGTREDAAAIALWGVPAGVIGARIYHVITDWQRFDDDLGAIVEVWEGGLGIWGGIALGTVVGIWAARRRGMPVGLVVTCATPALPLAQAIGRWGNWFNQELFGRPTDLPWALEVSDDKAVAAGHPAGTTFHPTFLYESLWNLFLCGFLLFVDKRWGDRLKPGRLFAVYVAGYTFARFFIERIRIDPANTIAGLRVNEWVSAVLFVGSVAYLAIDGFQPPEGGAEAAGDVDAEDVDRDTDAPVDAEDPVDADDLVDAEDLVDADDRDADDRDVEDRSRRDRTE